MAPWSFLKMNRLPITLTLVFAVGLVTCFLIAVLRKDVSPYMPFISETGGQFPEAGIFSMILYLSASLGLTTMFVRYLIVEELNKGINRSIDILNRATIVIGFIALMGMVVVAAYPMTSIPTAHNIGANILFFGADIYAALQTWMSFKMSPHYNGIVICYIRLVITVLSSLALISMLVLGPMAFGEWTSAKHSHWTGSKTPDDKGFSLLVGSSVAEWTMGILFIAYYFTFIREFGKVAVHLRVQLLVEHFDDNPEDINASIPNERSPILL